MSSFKVNLTAINPKDENKRTPPVEVLVDTADEVIFAEDSDMSLLGVHTIEGFGVMVDNIGQRFVETPFSVPANVMV